MRCCSPHHVRLGPRPDGFYNDVERDAFIERQTEAMSKALANAKPRETPMPKKDATPKGWHIEINESKRGRFRPLIKCDDTVRAIMPVGASFNNAKLAHIEGERIINVGVEAALAAFAAERGVAAAAQIDMLADKKNEHLTTVAKAVRDATQIGENDGRKAGMVKGCFWGATTVAALFIIAHWFFGSGLLTSLF